MQGEVLCFTNGGEAAEGVHHGHGHGHGHGHPSNLYNDVLLGTSYEGVAAGGSETALSIRSLLFSISILKDKVHDVESFVSVLLNQENNYHAQTTVDYGQLTSSMAFSSMAGLIQEIVQTASFMMLSCEQIVVLGPSQIGNTSNINSSTLVHTDHEQQTMQKGNNNDGLANFCVEGVVSKVNNQGVFDEDSFNHYQASKNTNQELLEVSRTDVASLEANDLVEVDAADLLARYTLYCQVCGRGFKREANLRMHMRTHGDKYKYASLISNNPLKKNNNNNEEHNNTTTKPPRKYSCPHKGCRWNKNHVKFQPLKSMVCVRNHYKRSHCLKMFVCKRCNTKEFSVLSDLKTHEKHCGDVKWYCSCGINFTKKDKLMDHVALFVGHTPLIYPLVTGHFG